MYHKHQYQLQTKDAIVKYFICVEHRRKNVEDFIIYFDENQKIVSTVFISISLICLFLHIVIYSTLKKLRQSLQSKNLLSLVCSMFFGQSLFLFGFDFTRSKTICVFISVASHYFLLVSFFCMNVISFDVCHTFINVLPVNSIKKRFKIYLYYSWATPAIIVAVANLVDRFPTHVLRDFCPDYATQVCWINNPMALLLFFILPISALVLENIFLFFMTIYAIHFKLNITQEDVVQKKDNSPGCVKFAENIEDDKKWKLHKTKVLFIVNSKLSFIMAVTWLTAFLASYLKLQLLWYPFILLNSIQGIFIFVVFDVKWKVYFTAYEKVMGKSHPNKNRKASMMQWMLGVKEKEQIIHKTEASVKENKFKKKAELLTKVLKWYKHDNLNKTVPSELEQPLSNYNAWQQLKIFQQAISAEEGAGEDVPSVRRTIERQSTIKL